MVTNLSALIKSDRLHHVNKPVVGILFWRDLYNKKITSSLQNSIYQQLGVNYE